MQTYLIATVKQGKPQFSEEQRKKLNKVFTAREGKLVQIAVGDIEKSRSGQQNRYLWGICYKLIAEETGHTEEELHETFKNLFLPKKYVKLGEYEEKITKSTTKLTTVEFEHYIERVRSFAAQELSIIVPVPER